MTLILNGCKKGNLQSFYIKTRTSHVYQIDYTGFTDVESDEPIEMSFSEIPDYLNPYKAVTISELFLQKALFATLLDQDPVTALPQLNLLEKYSISENGLVYYFFLKKNLKFGNGTTISSDDVIASLELVKGYLKNSIYHKFFFINNTELNIKKISATAFTINIDQPNSQIPFILTQFPIISKKLADGLTPDTTEENIELFINQPGFTSSGPYILKSHTPKETILTRNPFYFKLDSQNHPLPKTGKITIRYFVNRHEEIAAFIDGNSALLALNSEEYQDLYRYYRHNSNEKVKFIDTGYLPEKMMLTFNCYSNNSSPVLKDIEVRKYILAYFNNALKPVYNDQVMPQLSISQNELDEISVNYFTDHNHDGIRDDQSGNTVYLKVITFTERPELKSAAKILTETLEKLDFAVHLEILPYDHFIERLFISTDYDIALFYHELTPDLSGYLELLNKDSFSFSPFIDDQQKTVQFTDNLILQYLTLNSPETQLSLVNKLTHYFQENYQFCPLIQQKKYYLIKDNFYNFKINALYNPAFNLSTIEHMLQINTIE